MPAGGCRRCRCRAHCRDDQCSEVLGASVGVMAHRRTAPWRRRRARPSGARAVAGLAGHQQVDLAASAAAAVTVLRVAAFGPALSCSAITRIAMSDHLRFVLELVDQLGHVGHQHPGTAPGRFDHLEAWSARTHVHPSPPGSTVSSGFFLAFMMFGRVA